MAVRKDEWLGTNSFIWFFGVVEDINDPIHVGRVRVRAFGWHTTDSNKLASGDLPWAQVVMPGTNAASLGVGESPTGIALGSFVIGFFLDGERAQFPMVLGTVHGIPSTSGIPDTPKSAYDAYTKTESYAAKVAEITDYAAIRANSTYPKNHVTHTEAGHEFEVDDSSGSERIAEYHKAGSFREILPDGSRWTKIVGNDFEIIVEDKNVTIKGSCNVTVQGDANLTVSGDLNETVEGNYTLKVGGDYSVSIDGDTKTRRKAGGTDYTCPGDIRSPGIDCS